MSHENYELKVHESEKIERSFDDIKFRVGKHTKEMVDKIFKAAHDGDQDELDCLFQKVEARAHEMLTSEKLGDLPMPSKMEADIRTEGALSSS